MRVHISYVCQRKTFDFLCSLRISNHNCAYNTVHKLKVKTAAIVCPCTGLCLHLRDVGPLTSLLGPCAGSTADGDKQAAYRSARAKNVCMMVRRDLETLSTAARGQRWVRKEQLMRFV